MINLKGVMAEAPEVEGSIRTRRNKKMTKMMATIWKMRSLRACFTTYKPPVVGDGSPLKGWNALRIAPGLQP